MIQIAIFIVLSALVSGLLARSLTRLRIPRLIIANHRGKRVPVVLGLAVAGATAGVLVGALATAAASGAWTDGAATTATVAACALLVVVAGFLDDLSTGAQRGWRGHFGAARRGRATSGLLKVVAIAGAGGLAAWALIRPTDAATWGATLAAAIVIAGAANVVNGLDVVPGRAGKFFLVAGTVTAAAVPSTPSWVALIVVLGAEVGVLGFDLQERGMLGDAGSNLLGFALGAALVRALDLTGLVIAAVVVVVLNALAETVTFSRMIDAIRPIRWFDRLGRRPPGPTFSSN